MLRPASAGLRRVGSPPRMVHPEGFTLKGPKPLTVHLDLLRVLCALCGKGTFRPRRASYRSLLGRRPRCTRTGLSLLMYVRRPAQAGRPLSHFMNTSLDRSCTACPPVVRASSSRNPGTPAPLHGRLSGTRPGLQDGLWLAPLPGAASPIMPLPLEERQAGPQDGERPITALRGPCALTGAGTRAICRWPQSGRVARRVRRGELE